MALGYRKRGAGLAARKLNRRKLWTSWLRNSHQQIRKAGPIFCPAEQM